MKITNINHSKTFLDTLKSLFPLEEKINDLRLNHIGKSFLLINSYVAPPLAISEVLHKIGLNSFITLPAALSTMHLANKGLKQLFKPLLTSLSSVLLLLFQKTINLHHLLITPLMATAVFFIDKIEGNNKIDSSNENGHCKSDIKVNENEELDKNKSTKNKNVNNIPVSLIDFLKLQFIVNLVPNVINMVSSRLKELIEDDTNHMTRFVKQVGLYLFKVLGLSSGFVGTESLANLALSKLKVLEKGNTLAPESLACTSICSISGASIVSGEHFNH